MALSGKEGASAEQSSSPRELSTAEASPATASRLTESGVVRAGRTLDLGRERARYEIVRSLGRGGMAEVLLARRAGAGGLVREVALKCITPVLELDEGVRRAFLHEAQLAIRLRHPNIVEAYDFVEAGDRCYLVLEYIEGVSVKSVLQTALRDQKQL